MSRKPNCSYNCLIGMALKSSSTGKLPVGDIYRFFEREFPYFLSATEPWKNSLRHSLSLGHFFRKFNSDRMMTKKGHLWEVEPHKAAELDKEIYMFLAKAVPETLPNTSQLSLLQAQMAQFYLDPANRKSTSPFTGTILPTPGYFTPQGIPDNYTPNMIPYSDSMSCHSGFSGNTSNDPSSSLATPILADTIARTKSQATLRYNPNAEKLPHSSQEPSAGGTKSTQNVEASNQLIQTDGMPLVSEEAMQLIQFCNHCSFELSVDSPESNNTVWFNDSSQNGNSSYTKIMESSEQVDDIYQTVELSSPPMLCEEDVDNTYYPFITEPRGDCNVTLAKLNGGGYRTEPGAPRELQIKKCLRGKRMNGTLRKNSASFENAIRPVASTWNSWWEREYYILLMNDDMVTGSHGDNQCRENNIYYSMKRPYWHSKKKQHYTFLTPAKPLRPEPMTEIKSESGEITGKVQHKCEDKVDSRGSDWSMKRTGEENDTLKVKSPQNSLIDLREMLTRKKMASIYANLCLIISIPFHKLIIQRQVGRSVEREKHEGGKHRIFTGALK